MVDLMLMYLLVKCLVFLFYELRIKLIFKKHGVNDELIDMLKESVLKAKNPAKKAALMLRVAGFYGEGEFYDECYESLGYIDFNLLNNIGKMQYYNIYIYANTLQGNISVAEQLCRQGSFFINNEMIPAKLRAPVWHTIAVLEYAKGEYQNCENLLMQAMNSSKSRLLICDCNLYLGLCYLQTGRKEMASACADNAKKQVSSLYQRENLEKLKKLIEK